jgi:hypothetical protein
MRKITVLAVSGAFVLAASTSAFADSKSAAEFLLKTCLPAMDDLSKVEVMAQEGNWTPKPLPSFLAANSFRTSASMCEVIKSEEKFSVQVWTNHFGQQNYNICFVSFLSNGVDRSENVDREELLTLLPPLCS